MQYFKTEKQIEHWLDKMEIDRYSISKSLIVDVKSSVDLSNRSLNIIPIQFGEVKGSFDCSNNILISLKGAPSTIGHSFTCEKNQLLTLDHSPYQIGESFYCSKNPLISLEKAPKKIEKILIALEVDVTSLANLKKHSFQEINFSYSSGQRIAKYNTYYETGSDVLKLNKNMFDKMILKELLEQDLVVSEKSQRRKL